MSYRQLSKWREDSQFIFPPFRLDASDERLWRASQPLILRPKSFKLLVYLLDNPGKLLTKDALLDAVWPNIHVSDAVLRGCIREIRQVLDDLAGAPKFVETVPRRGYRFIAHARRVPVESPKWSNGHVPRVDSDNHEAPAPIKFGGIVGRDREFEQLGRSFEEALRGSRQIIFVVGEPGIGKTTLVEAFVGSALVQKTAWLGYGQCLEHGGAGEAYMPVLEALSRLCRGAEGEQIISVLEKYAPTWLLQMPSLLGAEAIERLQRRVGGFSQERMLREFAEAVEMIAARRPLILVIEDLRWADHSTLELISMLANRREPSRFVLVATYRQADVRARTHPLRAVENELLRHRGSERLPLSPLTDEAVVDYLNTRFPKSDLPNRLAQLICARTEGNPLFMVDMTNQLIAQGAITPAETGWELQLYLEKVDLGVPDNLRQLIEREMEALSADEQRMLEAASIVGMEVSSARIAAALNWDIEDVEQRSNALTRHSHFLKRLADVEWPDGTVAACYSFAHQLYQKVLYDRVSAGQRTRLHQRIGERQEVAFAGHLGEIASNQAMHFEASRDYRRAVHYHDLAAQDALHRHANHEAANHLTKAISLLGALPEGDDRARAECSLQNALGAVLKTIKGYTASEVGVAYSRARELSNRIGDSAQLARALHGLCIFNFKRALHSTARDLGEQLFALASRDPGSAIEAHFALAATKACLGQFSAAYNHAVLGIAMYDPAVHRSHAHLYGQDPGVFSHLWASITSWYLGYPDRALNHSRETQARAKQLGNPTDRIVAAFMAAVLHQLRREPAIAREYIATAIELAEEHGMRHFMISGAFMRGWVLTLEGHGPAGIEQMRRALAELDEIKSRWYRPYNLALLAESYSRIGRPKDGLEILQQALGETSISSERFYDAELYRLQGELTLRSRLGSTRRQGQYDAEQSFMKAINVARDSGAKSLQLRATISLSRLWQGTRNKKAAHCQLELIYDSFTEGFDTSDLIEARELLTALS